MQSAVERWQALHDARAQQMNTAYARLGRSSADFWDRRARGFHRATKATVGTDPLFSVLQKVVTPQTTVLDVGAGTGRFALALAPQARHVTVVEPNASMLNYLRQDAAAAGISNISEIPTTWQDAPDDLQADIVICSHVLYPIRDIVPFLTKLHAATRQFCYILMRAVQFDAILDHLWRAFHHEPRHQSPTYIHALDVLYEMGIYANVTIVTPPISLRYSSLENAVDELQEQLLLPGDEATRTHLRQLLEPWLVERDGMLMPPVDKLPSAIIELAP